jgi:DNA-directed RNA polymerase specialized sigma24 family protein
MPLLEDRQTRGFVSVTAPPSGLEKRISFLPDPDRKLVELSLNGRLKRREAALLLGLSAGTVTRRLKRLMTRLNDPLVVAAIDHGDLLPEGYKAVAIGYFLRGMTVRQISRALGMNVHEIERAVSYVRGWFKGTAVNRGK